MIRWLTALSPFAKCGCGGGSVKTESVGAAGSSTDSPAAHF